MNKWRLQFMGSWLIISAGAVNMIGYSVKTVVLLTGLGLLFFVLRQKELRRYLHLIPVLIVLMIMAGISRFWPTDWPIFTRLLVGMLIMGGLLSILLTLTAFMGGRVKQKM